MPMIYQAMITSNLMSRIDGFNSRLRWKAQSKQHAVIVSIVSDIISAIASIGEMSRVENLSSAVVQAIGCDYAHFEISSFQGTTRAPRVDRRSSTAR